MKGHQRESLRFKGLILKDQITLVMLFWLVAEVDTIPKKWSFQPIMKKVCTSWVDGLPKKQWRRLKTKWHPTARCQANSLPWKTCDVLGSKLLIVPKKNMFAKGSGLERVACCQGSWKSSTSGSSMRSGDQTQSCFKQTTTCVAGGFVYLFLGCGYKHCRDGRETPQNNNSQKSTPCSTEPRPAFSSCRLISLEQSRSISSKMSSPVRTLQSAKHGGTQRHVVNATTVFRPWGSASDFLVSSSAS